MKTIPLVSIVTPVHNAEPYLAECIESVLKQTYKNWHYVMVNNCSTDSSLEIARRYANQDSRISVLSNPAFVGLIENHNIAVQRISPNSRYCKVVSADDWLFPECLSRMVEFAEANPSVGIVNSYQLSGGGGDWKVRWDEIAYPSPVTPGREICRSQLLGGPYVFGTPTSSLYRADLVRARPRFYPHLLPHADTSACYECLRKSDFGFVHQILSFERIHANTISAECKKIRTLESAILRNLIAYGPVYLTEQEYKARLKQVLAAYYGSLAVGFFNFSNLEYWRYHHRDLTQLGFRCFGFALTKAIVAKFLNLVLNPKQTADKILRRHHPAANSIVNLSRPSALCPGSPVHGIGRVNSIAECKAGSGDGAAELAFPDNAAE